MLWLLIVIIIFATAAVLWGPIMSNVDQAKYTVVESFGDIEIRDYPPMIIAEVEVSGERDTAANKGFRLLADYIFGNNKTQHKIAMTAPVIEESNEHGWKIKFVMPSSYSIETLPNPNNNAVKLIPTESKHFVVIRFSGMITEKNLQKHLQKLITFVKAKNLKSISEPIYAFFNPPWTLPLLRRNEIMIEINY